LQCDSSVLNTWKLLPRNLRQIGEAINRSVRRVCRGWWVGV
jgi:hypothetical protein